MAKGLQSSTGTALSGNVVWGPGFSSITQFGKMPASLVDGLYVTGGSIPGLVPVGSFKVSGAYSGTICDFSPSHSPADLPAGWMGVLTPNYMLYLPAELFHYTAAWERQPVLVPGQNGRFEGNGTFSGSVNVNLPDLVNLHIAPIRMEPFDLHFMEGSLIDGPVVKAQLEMTAQPLLVNFKAPLTFHMTQAGATQIEINTQTPGGPMAVKTRLVGIDMVLDSARLNATNLDFTGCFDFAIAGAPIPSVDFDHLVLEASGAGIDGSGIMRRKKKW